MSSARKLPNDVAKYACSPTFTSQNVPDRFLEAHSMEQGSLSTVPNKLLDVHDLKAGTWGLLNVESGEVTYFLAGETEPLQHLVAGDRFVIKPEEQHFITVSDDAIFFIEFLRKPQVKPAFA